MNSAVSSHAPATPINVTANSTMTKLPDTAATKARSAAWLPRSRYSESTGTKASANVDSANRRRKKFGMRNAR